MRVVLVRLCAPATTAAEATLRPLKPGAATTTTATTAATTTTAAAAAAAAAAEVSAPKGQASSATATATASALCGPLLQHVSDERLRHRVIEHKYVLGRSHAASVVTVPGAAADLDEEVVLEKLGVTLPAANVPPSALVEGVDPHLLVAVRLSQAADLVDGHGLTGSRVEVERAQDRIATASVLHLVKVLMSAAACRRAHTASVPVTDIGLALDHLDQILVDGLLLRRVDDLVQMDDVAAGLGDIDLLRHRIYVIPSFPPCKLAARAFGLRDPKARVAGRREVLVPYFGVSSTRHDCTALPRGPRPTACTASRRTGNQNLPWGGKQQPNSPKTYKIYTALKG